MATAALVRAAIKAKLLTVANIGQVHGFERYAKTEKAMRDFYYDVAQTRIIGWNISRVRFARTELDVGELRRVDFWRITGFMGLEDADSTELLMDSLVEDIATAFKSDPTLGGNVDMILDGGNPRNGYGIQADDMGPVMFAGHLCHRARLSLVTDTTETI